MKWKNRLTNYNFWISIVSAVLLIFQAFDFQFDLAYVNEIATAVLGLLVVIGIISDPTKSASETTLNSSCENSGEVATTEINNDANNELVLSESNTLENSVNVSNENTHDESMDNKNENIIPIDSENETNTDTGKNDFEVLIEKIKSDLLDKIDELSKNIIQAESIEIESANNTEGNIKVAIENDISDNGSSIVDNDGIIQNEDVASIENKVDNITTENVTNKVEVQTYHNIAN